jgi:DNA-binding MarR family transcriptional regulator
MSESRPAPELFGDALALARGAWIRQMAARLTRCGFDDYRRSDAAVFRLLLAGPVPVGRLGNSLGVTRQAARKVADGLATRGLATTERDLLDGRRLNVVLSAAGESYGRAVVRVVRELNAALGARVDPEDLARTRVVLAEVVAMGADGLRAVGGGSHESGGPGPS